MRQVAAVLLAGLVAARPMDLGSTPALAMIQGYVSVQGRPLTGIELALINIQSGAIQRTRSEVLGTFSARVAPGQYVVTTENRAGLVVGTAPAMIAVGSGQVASTRIDLLPLPYAVLPAQEPGQAPQQPGEPPAPGDPVSATTINHDPVGCLIAGEFPLLDAAIEPMASVARARVYFKAARGSSFYYVEMSPSDGRFLGKLPRPKVEASPINYYIQATTTEFGESQTQELTAIVVAQASDCPEDKKVAGIGPPGEVTVFSAATGAAIAPAGFVAGGLGIAIGTLALIIGGAAAAGILAAITVFNPDTPPPPTTTLPPPPTTTLPPESTTTTTTLPAATGPPPSLPPVTPFR